MFVVNLFVSKCQILKWELGVVPNHTIRHQWGSLLKARRLGGSKAHS
jgi:hypothetical protein